MFTPSRTEVRDFFFGVWKKHGGKEIMTPLELQALDWVLEHPEYHPLLAAPDKYRDKDYLPEFGEVNPFLHLSLQLLRTLLGFPLQLLDLPQERVHIIMGDSGTSVNQGGGSGSTGVQFGGVALKNAAAEARRSLLHQLHAAVGEGLFALARRTSGADARAISARGRVRSGSARRARR